MTHTAANKARVEEFIRAFYNEKNFDHARELLTEDFINHHHGVGMGRERTIETFCEQAAIPFPQFTLTIYRMVAEGDQVWTHGVVRVAPDASPVIVVDIWRLKNGLLAEHWDVSAAVPQGSTLDELIGNVS